jgi:glucosamine kinase
MPGPIVVGIDGGGTFTRALVADLRGCVLAYAEAGGANPNHHPQARENVQEAIHRVLEAAGREPGQVVSLVAGFAGLDSSESQTWSEEFTAVPGLNCPRLQVNDAVIAHAGALRSQPGIIAISGTGSIVFGVTPEGRHVRNYDFHHYAHSAARYLSYAMVHRIIAGETEMADREFVQEVLEYWEVSDLGALCELGMRGFQNDRQERNYRFGAMAGRVTEAAAQGVPVARAVCDQAAAAVATEIRLVGACFPEGTVPAALIGGVVRSPYMARSVEEALSRKANRQYRVVEPALSSVQGAVLMALERSGTAVDDALVGALAAASSLIPQ